jgi:precorrin-2 dehydrogenase
MSTTRPRPLEHLAPVREMLERWRKRDRVWETRAYYPAILDVAGREALVVGAGKVGEGKIAGLLAAEANVEVVSMAASPQVKRWAEEGKVTLALRPFADSDLEGKFLVIAATEDNATNVRVYEGAEKRHILCNVVDVPHLCNFILPSIVRHGDLAIAVSTGGASPALARRIRISIGGVYGDEYAVALQVLGALRKELKEKYPAPGDRKVIFERMVYENFVALVRAGDVEGLESWVQTCIDEGPEYTSPEAHRAMLEAAPPEGEWQTRPLFLDEAS